MTRAKPLLATLLLTLLTAPVAWGAGGPLDLTDRLEERLNDAAEQARAADAPAQKRLILSNAFRDMRRALDRTKRIPGLSSETLAALGDLQQNLAQRDARLNGLDGFAPVPDADLDRFADDVQTNLLNDQKITIGLGTALLIVIVIILLA